MNVKLDSSFLDDALRFAPRELQYQVVDALACHLHNTGYALQGNTSENDVEWLARSLYDREHMNDDGPRWGDNRPSEEEKQRWRVIAALVIEVLPAFQLRVASRCIELSKVLRDIERSLRRP